MTILRFASAGRAGQRTGSTERSSTQAFVSLTFFTRRQFYSELKRLANLVARANFPAKDLKELVAYVRAQGDKVTYGNVGLGSASHLCGLMFMSTIEAKLTPIYYKGGGPALNVTTWYGLYAPRSTPKPIVDALVEALQRRSRILLSSIASPSSA
jgi:hypothetical protein